MNTTLGLPAFVVIGAQKSASTFLQDQMAQHPAIEIAEGEVRTFEDPHYSPEAVARLPELFEDNASEGRGGLAGTVGIVRGIKRPDYLCRPEVPSRLAEHLPEAKLFVVIREPIARAVSAYFHYVRHGFVPLRPIDEAFTNLMSDAWADDYPRSAEVLDYGNYGKHLSGYLGHFDRGQILVFEQKSLITAPETALRQAFDFVGVSPGFRPSSNAVSNKGVYSPARLRWLRSKNRFTHRYTPGLDRREPRRKSPLGWLWNAGVVGVDRLVLSRLDPGRPPELSAELRGQLAEYYA
ncbi:MAG: sulfotransferase family protein, partial [Nocardioides sp.]